MRACNTEPKPLRRSERAEARIGISKTFSSKAVVCKDVADECNLGTAFLQSIHRATGLKPRLEFSQDGTRLVLGQDQVELVRRMAPLKPTVEATKTPQDKTVHH